jgi:deltex-like protein
MRVLCLRKTDHVMKGQYEFETVCSAGMLAMEMRPEKKYRPLTRQELAAFVRKQESAKSVAEEDVCAICQMSLVDLEETKPIAVSGSSGSSSTSSSSTSSSSSSNGRCGGGNVGVGGGAGGGGGGGENKSAKSAGKVKQEESDVDDDDDTEQDVINKTETKPENILVRSHNCHHVLHMECMKSLIESKSSTSTVCPECRTPYVSGVRFGSGPVGVLAVNHVGSSLPGFPNEGTIQMEVYFKSGIQGPRHPTPGAHYVAHGFPRSFYMPESQAALAFRLQLAFYWRIIFKIGTSQTTHEPDSVIWTGAVPVKSNFEPGQTRSFSDVPQENLDYFERLSRDLDAVGITAAFAELTHKHLRTPIV